MASRKRKEGQLSRIKIGRPSAGLIVGVLALVVALGGSAVAITALTKKEKQQVRKIAKKLDKGVAKSASKEVKGLRREIRTPFGQEIPLPVADKPGCGATEGWYGYSWGETGEIISTFIDLSREVRISGSALYCGGPKVAFTLPKPFRPTDYTRRFPVVVADEPPESADVTVIVDPRGFVQVGLNGRVSVPNAEVGDIVDFGSVSYEKSTPPLIGPDGKG